MNERDLDDPNNFDKYNLFVHVFVKLTVTLSSFERLMLRSTLTPLSPLIRSPLFSPRSARVRFLYDFDSPPKGVPEMTVSDFDGFSYQVGDEDSSETVVRIVASMSYLSTLRENGLVHFLPSLLNPYQSLSL